MRDDHKKEELLVFGNLESLKTKPIKSLTNK